MGLAMIGKLSSQCFIAALLFFMISLGGHGWAFFIALGAFGLAVALLVIDIATQALR